MISKALIKSAIKEKKKDYFENEISYALVEAAIYKGLYRAVGGSKVIALPNKFENMVTTAELFFKFNIKIKEAQSDEEVKSIFNKLLNRYNKRSHDEISVSANMSNDKLTDIFIVLLFEDYTEDIVINKNNIYNTVYKLLEDDFSIFK